MDRTYSKIQFHEYNVKCKTNEKFYDTPHIILYILLPEIYTAKPDFHLISKNIDWLTAIDYITEI